MKVQIVVGAHGYPSVSRRFWRLFPHKRVGGYVSSDPSPYAHCGDHSVWEVEVRDRTSLPCKWPLFGGGVAKSDVLALKAEDGAWYLIPACQKLDEATVNAVQSGRKRLRGIHPQSATVEIQD